MKHDPYIENNIGFALPSQIEEDIFQITCQLSSADKSADALEIITRIVSDMKQHATLMLVNNGADPIATVPKSELEVEQSPAVANATAVLHYANELLEALKTKKHLEAILIMYKLASSAVRVELLQKAFEGFNLAVAQENGGKASPKLKSLIPLLEQAIASGCKTNAKALWTYIEKNHPSDSPFIFEGDKAPTSSGPVEKLELYFDRVNNQKTGSEEEMIFECGPKGEEKKLTFYSFKRYITEVNKLLQKK